MPTPQEYVAHLIDQLKSGKLSPSKLREMLKDAERTKNAFAAKGIQAALVANDKSAGTKNPIFTGKK